MINHARTLLLNCHTYGPGTEYVSPDYKPKERPECLHAIWDLLYGADLDDFAKNYRTRQLMTILHSTELVHYVYELDPRITYWPTSDTDCHVDYLVNGLLPIELLLTNLEKLLADDKQLFDTLGIPKELGEIWRNDPRFTHRISSVLLAYILHMDAHNEMEKH